MRKMLTDHWARTNYVCHNRSLPKPMCYRCENIYWLTLAFPFIILYIYSTLILTSNFLRSEGHWETRLKCSKIGHNERLTSSFLRSATLRDLARRSSTSEFVSVSSDSSLLSSTLVPPSTCGKKNLIWWRSINNDKGNVERSSLLLVVTIKRSYI